MNIKNILVGLVTYLATYLFAISTSHAGSDYNSAPAAQGYDVVSYFNAKRPVRGNGNYIAEYNDAVYLFSSKENQQLFSKNPKKYAPAYGGYCAFGVSVGKKFVGDPEVWKIVDDTLYLNLDSSIQARWLEDTENLINRADGEWKKIKGKSRASL